MLRAVWEAELPRPSTKASAAGGLPSIAANRDREPKQLVNWLRGDIDWIVMTALEKDRGYATANGLAQDVQRLLADAADRARSAAVAEAQATEQARRGEEEQRTNVEQANRQAFEALQSFTDELKGSCSGRGTG